MRAAVEPRRNLFTLKLNYIAMAVEHIKRNGMLPAQTVFVGETCSNRFLNQYRCDKVRECYGFDKLNHQAASIIERSQRS